jgi:uncharacterized protein (TIGR00266 family)
MEATVREGQAPALVVQLAADEEIHAEAGAMMFMTGDVAMDTEFGAQDLKGGIKRAFSGESMFHVRYKGGPGGGVVGLTGPYPGSIRQHELDGEIICERHAYLCHHGEVTVEPIIAAKRGMGIMGGGEGFILQKISGKGTVWLHAGGDFVDFDLVEGQNLVVDTGCMVMFESTVTYETKMQKGLRSAFAGGEGLFLVYMTGPGHVTLQTLPFSRIAQQVEKAEGGGKGERGGILGNLLEG